MLLSFMETPKDIPVIADIFELKRTSPDWMMAYISDRELANPAALEQVQRNMNALHPKLGMCFIVVDAAAVPDPEALPENARAVVAGFDESQFACLLDKLAMNA